MNTAMSHTIRSALWLVFFAAVLAAWWMMYVMAADMDLDLLGRPGAAGAAMQAMDPFMPMYMPMAQFGPVFAMWAIMMAAMMLPTMVPTLRSYEDLMRGAGAAGATWAGWLGVLAGYAIMWLGFAAGITALQMALLYGGVIDMLGIAKSHLLGAALLFGVGAFQFTRTKEICHGVCHAPMMYFLGHWRGGGAGGLRMGLGLGVYCVICCWGFMALGFVGGVMNLAWMGLATLCMVLEKLPQIGHRVVRPLGVAMMMGAVVWAIMPPITGG